MFSNARNFVFTGNPTFTNHFLYQTSALTVESLDEDIKTLLQHVAKGAMHNSGERFDAPTCHPETRRALQNDILGWVNEAPSRQLVTWMHGPAGAGKSAIAQTVSQKLHVKGQLSASFFFSRTSASKGRGDESALIATLAYQLCLTDPAAKPLVARAVRENPLIFDLSLEDQVQALIVHPVAVLRQNHGVLQRPKVIVVDGLDECKNNGNAQSRVVKALIMGLSSIPHHSYKLLITSRPEHNIVAIFRDYKPELLRRMDLNNKWNPDDDIRTFLEAGFMDIRHHHPYFESQPADQAWPSHASISTLVARSSGQFIYASVVIKYIRSEDYYDPAARLEVILKLENNEDRPYAELDALYEYIFSQVRGVEKVLTVLSLDRMHSDKKFNAPLSLTFLLSHFIGARIEEIKFWLRPLVSLLVWEKNAIRYMHASLSDFLLDESRSNGFCIHSASIVTGIVQRALDLLNNQNTLGEQYFAAMLLMMPGNYTNFLSPQHKIHIYSMLSNFDIIEVVVSRMHAGLITRETTEALALYFEWILTESEGDNQGALVRPLSQIQTWIAEGLAHKQFNWLDQPSQVTVDLWPFFAWPVVNGWGWTTPEELQHHVSDEIAAVLEICGLDRSSDLPARDGNVKLPDQAVLFRCLMPYIPRWIASTNLLGRYAMTGERYTVALLRVSRYLLRLPKRQLVRLLTHDNAKLSAPMCLAKKVFSMLMRCVPHSVELYFFVLFMYSVMVYHDQVLNKQISKAWEAHDPLAIGKCARTYLLLTRLNIPFLRDPASPEYVQAQANAEASWIKTMGNLYEPISIRIEHLPGDL